MPAKPRIVQVRNIAGAGDVDRELRRLTGVSRQTAWRWRNSVGVPAPFPRPIKRLRSGKLWDLAEVRAWLADVADRAGQEP